MVTPLALQFALHGAIALMSGLVGGLFFAGAIKLKRGEVAWRVVHATFGPLRTALAT